MVFIIITIFLITKILTIITLLNRWYLKQIGFPKQVSFEKTLKNMYSIGITYCSQKLVPQFRPCIFK